METRQRKLLGSLGLMLFITLYALLAAAIGSALSGAPILVQTLYFLIAGLAWALPLKPLFRWMNGG